MGKQSKRNRGPSDDQKKMIDLGWDQLDHEMSQLFLKESSLIASYLLNEMVANESSFETEATKFGMQCLRNYQAWKLISAGVAVQKETDAHTVPDAA